jgi:hypothetical protein
MKIEYLRNPAVLNIAITIFYSKNMAFSLWERLPAANIASAPCCKGLSQLRAVSKKKMTERNDIHKSSIVNSHFYRL